jgi:uncharacterized protein (DUF1800 family)
MAQVKLRFAVALFSAGLVPLGCSAPQTGKTGPQSPGTLFVTNGPQLTVSCQQSVALSASDGSAKPLHLTWSQMPSDSAAGNLTADGTYTAPLGLTSNRSITITATNSDTGASASTLVTLVNPTPVAKAITPTTVAAGAAVSGVIAGNLFVPGTSVLVNGVPVSTSYLSPTSLSFALTMSAWANGDNQVSVVTGGPGGGTSNSLTMHISPPSISYDAAVRFLQQGTWGATPSLVQHVQTVGFSAFLDEQLAAPMDPYVTDNDPMHVTETLWSHAALNDYSQLRTKTSWAWYKLFNAPGSTSLSVLAAVPEITNRDAFANFKTLLTDVSLNTEMGMFLNYCCWDPAGAEPNENFGREAMQLFTIGPDLLNQDGTPILDANGRPQPSYTSSDIEAVSRAVTGFFEPYDPWTSTDTEAAVAMVDADATQHDTNAKTLLGNTLPGGQDARADTQAAIDVLTDHPNTAPHISAYLIHEFVTSNPTPAYVARVASVWADNGKGVRGDIAAVIKALLLDPEARAGDDPTFTEAAEFGRFRDSVNFGSTIIRALNAGTPTTHTWGAANTMANLSHEPVFSAPSVFGYYVQNFTLPNTQLLAPESQIYTADAVAARADFVYNLIYVPPTADQVISAINWGPWTSLATGDGRQLIDAINHLFFHGTMSPELYQILQNNLQQMPASDLVSRAQQTIYLAIMSPEFAVER